MRLFLILIFLMSTNAHAIKLAPSFTKTVAATGTPECIVASNNITRAPDVVIQALSTNTGGVWIGDSSVTASGPGMRIEAKQAVTFANVLKKGSAQHFTLKDICLAVEVNGEGVTVTYTIVNP